MVISTLSPLPDLFVMPHRIPSPNPLRILLPCVIPTYRRSTFLPPTPFPLILHRSNLHPLPQNLLPRTLIKRIRLSRSRGKCRRFIQRDCLHAVYGLRVIADDLEERGRGFRFDGAGG